MTTTTATPTTGPTGRSFHYAHNIYFQDGVVFSTIIVGLLYLLVAASLDGAGYVKSMGLLYPVTLGAIGMSLLMAYSRFDSFFAFSHGMFTGLAWILFLMRDLVTVEDSKSFMEFGFPELQAQVYFVLYRLMRWVQLAWGGQASADNYMFIFEICLLVWWLTYLGIWAIFRHGYTWRAIMPAGIVMLINTYFAPQSVTGFLFLFAFLALILLVRTNLAEQQLRWRYQRTYFSQDITLDFLRTGLIYALCVMAIAWFAPGLGRSGPVRDLLRPLNDQWVSWNEEVNKLYPNLIRQVRPSNSAFGRSLTLSGERNVGQEIIFTVSTARGRYWRAVVFDSFDGRQWQNTSTETVSFAEAAVLPVPNWLLREPITQTIQLMAPTGDVIFGAPDIYLATIPIDAQVEAAPAGSITSPSIESGQPQAQAVEFTYARSSRTLDVGDSYTIISRQTAVTENALKSTGASYSALITDKFLQLPENFSPRVGELARTITEPFPTVYEKTKAVESYLRGIPYDDKIPAPGAGVDPLEYFLFEIQRGYCDYYASAMATMLRSVGIPARTASGYAEGSYDEESNLYYVTASDAHTWVEVYFPDYGWVEFEPTAGESELNRPVGDEPGSEADPLGSSNPVTTTNLPDTNPYEDQLMNQPENTTAGGLDGVGGGGGIATWPWWVWLILAPVVLIAGIWGLRFIPIWGPTNFTPDLPPILYERLQRWTERLGLRLSESDTPFEREQRLGQALPEGRPFVQRITQSYVRYRFSRQNQDNNALFRPPASQGQAPGQTLGNDLGQSWQALERVFWKAWARKLYYTLIRRRTSPYSLTGK